MVGEGIGGEVGRRCHDGWVGDQIDFGYME